MSSHLEKLREATTDQVMDNPEYYGMPSFDSFKRNYEKFMGRDDDLLSQADKGSVFLKDVVQRHKFEIEGYRCDSLEEVERVALQQGIPIKELDFRPILIPTGGGKADVLIKFVSKQERERRNAIL